MMGLVVLTQLDLSVVAGAVLVKSYGQPETHGGGRCPRCNGTGRETCTCNGTGRERGSSVGFGLASAKLLNEPYGRAFGTRLLSGPEPSPPPPLQHDHRAPPL
ncbi:hypothetical protein ACFE04_007325 [Oxalis oulophora]